MLLDKVLRFFITIFLAIAGGALMQLASPLLAFFISTEILKMDMGIFRITLANLLCILLGAVLGGIIGFFCITVFYPQAQAVFYLGGSPVEQDADS